MPNKKPNYLATRLEQQAARALALPSSVNQQLNKLFSYTSELKTILVDSLPNEILSTMWVVGFDNQQLTLAVTSQTAANHLLYLSNPLATLITTHSLTFSTLNHIKVIVTYTPNKGDKPLLNSTSSAQSNELNSNTNIAEKSSNTLSKSPINIGLTPKTKQTIAQTIEHVILDKDLKKSLQKLIED